MPRSDERKRSRVTALALLLASLAGGAIPRALAAEADPPADARQDRPGGPPPPGRPGPAPGPDGQRPPDEDLRETITLLMLARMKRQLDLTDAQYAQVVPKVEEREQARMELFRDRRAIGARIRMLLARESTRDAELSGLADRMVALDDAERRSDTEFAAEMRKILAPRQQAEFQLFRMEFREWVERRMRDARELRRQRSPGPPARGRPTPDAEEPEPESQPR